MPIVVRDGVTLYADIYRPTGDGQVPVILNSTTFGKRKINGEAPVTHAAAVADDDGEMLFSVVGVPQSWTSGLETFEGSDPGFFAAHGYAVCNLDIRGCYMSQGDGQYFGTQEAEDDHDVIEWLAAQSWCTGRVAMTGNSWLGICQWFAAAEQPEHLTCFAPWEGWSDMYRDEYMVGGIPDYSGFRYKNSFSDTGMMEDVVANMLAHPLLDEYWEDKAAALKNITIPAYIAASYTSPIHSAGTLRGYRDIASENKWLRIHNTQEWQDSYRRSHEEDLLKFFDHFMKNIDNGWENTPKVRLSVLDPGGRDIVERPENEFPLKRQQLKELWLDASDMSLKTEKPEAEASVSYCSFDGKGDAVFRMTVQEEMEVVGYVNARFWGEVHGYNDMDLFVKVSKYDAEGRRLAHSPTENDRVIAYNGPCGRLRASMRELDKERSTPNEPYYTYNNPQKLSSYEVVPLEVGLVPTGMRFHPGEILELSIRGYLNDNILQHAPTELRMGIDNNGRHIIHTGGRYDSKLILPVIPINE